MSIREETEKVLEQQNEIPMRRSTIVYYGRCFEALAKYCEEQRHRSYTEKVHGKYVEYQTGRAERGEIGWIYWSSLRKAGEMLLEWQKTGKIKWQRRKSAKAELCGQG